MTAKCESSQSQENANEQNDIHLHVVLHLQIVDDIQRTAKFLKRLLHFTFGFHCHLRNPVIGLL